MKNEKQIFKNGSTTYYWSSRFFPEKTRQDVFKLYSFVRIADDFVDCVPQDKKHFLQLEKAWNLAVKKGTLPNKKTDSKISLAVNNMYEVFNKYQLDPKWVSAFLKAMKNDIGKKEYLNLNQTIQYMYGSAEVIGLMMCKIIGVPKEGYYYAQMQGRAMQYINFIRDIKEDISLGRCYFPKSEIKKYGLKELSEGQANKHPAEFKEFIEGQLMYYKTWQAEANKGFKFVPRTQRIALRTAVDMYNYTAKNIAKNPFLVFNKNIKPSKYRVVGRALVRSIHA
ncbi:phytoene/squalene synthase family protein [Candidatus Saccharibacteria bacterium]|nr:phytoene/squalene synthase family protein [Candidatus Saccharibacteria bacterium]